MSGNARRQPDSATCEADRCGAAPSIMRCALDGRGARRSLLTWLLLRSRFPLRASSPRGSTRGKVREVEGKTVEVEAKNTGVLDKTRAVFGETPATMRQGAVSLPRDAVLYGRKSRLMPWTSKTSGKASRTLPNECSTLGKDTRADTNEPADQGKKPVVLPGKISLSGSVTSLCLCVARKRSVSRLKPGS